MSAKISGIMFEKQDIFIIISISYKCLLKYKKSNFKEDNFGRYHLNQVIKINMTSSKAYRPWEENNSIS